MGWRSVLRDYKSPLTYALECLYRLTVAQFALMRMAWGRYALAVGANEEAARYTGVNRRPIKVAVFGLSGLLAACAAVLQCARLSSADPNAGAGAELQAIAACVIGGASLSGGRGSVVNTFFRCIDHRRAGRRT